MEGQAGGPEALRERLARPGPKRLLALDGGGIRGLISLGYLARMEAILRDQHGDRELVLADYFDLIGGTSTGAVIATLLSLGWSVGEIHQLYRELGRLAFQPKKSWFGPVGRLLGAKFDDRPLAELFHKHLGERRLDSPDLRTGLLVVAKRADTGSVWALVNIPTNKFYEMNRHMRLWEILRSSTAAPTFFKPQYLTDVGGGEEAVFVDGGVSMHNNPSVKLLMVATLEGFGLQWPLGSDELLLCSLGTGSFTPRAEPDAIRRYTSLNWAALMATQLIRDSSELNQTLLQWISRSPNAAAIDSQIGDLREDQLAGRPLISYLRYDVELEPGSLNALGFNYGDGDVRSLRQMSDVANIEELERIGQASAASLVDAAHFPPGFVRP